MAQSIRSRDTITHSEQPLTRNRRVETFLVNITKQTLVL